MIFCVIKRCEIKSNIRNKKIFIFKFRPFFRMPGTFRGFVYFFFLDLFG
jgi:hypothetical protein